MSKGEIDRKNNKIKSSKYGDYVGYKLKGKIMSDNRQPRPVPLGCRQRVMNAYNSEGLIGAYRELQKWNEEYPKASFTVDDCNRWIEEEYEKSNGQAGKSKESKNDGR